MQLNPARGRKLGFVQNLIAKCHDMVYAAQPREGTETWTSTNRAGAVIMTGLCSSTPRGDGN